MCMNDMESDITINIISMDRLTEACNNPISRIIHRVTKCIMVNNVFIPPYFIVLVNVYCIHFPVDIKGEDLI